MNARQFRSEMMLAVDETYARGAPGTAPAFIFAKSDVPDTEWGHAVWGWAKHKTPLASGDEAAMLARGQCEQILYDAGWERHGPGDWRNYESGFVAAFPEPAA